MTTRHTGNNISDAGAGFRYSPYGMAYYPGPSYWARVAQAMVNRFDHVAPEAIWIVGILEGHGTHLTFPGSTAGPGISFAQVDENQEALNLFDQLGIRVWLQVEPGDAKVETLFDLILARYKHHPSVVGVGVDVEWHHSSEKPEGSPVDDAEATAWLSAARAHGTQYRLFLKHWESSMLTPTLRDGLLFVDDSQMFDSLEAMIAEFAHWGKHFYPAPVAFQFGYPADKKWWGQLRDPPKEIGEAILSTIPNAQGIYWVNFSVLDVFPR